MKLRFWTALAAATVAAFIVGMGVWIQPVRAQSSPPEPMRALWITRTQLTSAEKIHRAVVWAKAAGANTLFIQVRGRGSLFYPSPLEPFSDELPAPFDALGAALAETRAAGLELHAWVNLHYIWSRPELPADPRHLMNDHPEWVTAARDGYFLDPAAGGVSDHLLAVVQDLVSRYPVDGIHLDYVRYPYDRDVTPKDPRAVTALVKAIRKRLNATAPAMRLSAAVIMPVSAARDRVAQVWPEWIRTGLLDFVVPMAYTADPARFEGYIKEVAELPSAASKVIGVGTYLMDSFQWTAEVAAVRRAAQNSGVAGVALFSYDSLMNENPETIARAWR